MKQRWFLDLQNLRFELKAAKSEWSRLNGLYPKNNGQYSYQRGVLNECCKSIKDIERALNQTFPRELFIWQTLLSIQQRFLLIVPVPELPAKWTTLNKRLQDLPEEERGQYGSKEFVESINTRLAKGAPLIEDAAQGLRSDMVEVRHFLDDKYVVELWIAFRLRRYSVTFAMLAVALVIYLAVDIIVLRLGCLSQEWLKCSDSYSIPAMIAAGSLGALVSALSSGLKRKGSGNPPLVQTFFVRPIIGGVAGLVVYFVAQTDAVQVMYPGLYVVAIAFGFSERAFYNVLDRLAGNTEGRLAKLSRLG